MVVRLHVPLQAPSGAERDEEATVLRKGIRAARREALMRQHAASNAGGRTSLQVHVQCNDASFEELEARLCDLYERLYEAGESGEAVVLFDDVVADGKKAQFPSSRRDACATSNDAIEFDRTNVQHGGHVYKKESLSLFEEPCGGATSASASSETAGTSSAAPRPLPSTLFDHACVGGTFDRLHAGHKLLLSTAALRTRTRLLVGIAGGPLLSRKLLRDSVQPFPVRAAAVEEFVKAVRPSIEVHVFELRDAFGPAADDARISILIASEETATIAAARACNEVRARAGLAALALHTVPLLGGVRGESAKLSSGQIRADELGRLCRAATQRRPRWATVRYVQAAHRSHKPSPPPPRPTPLPPPHPSSPPPPSSPPSPPPLSPYPPPLAPTPALPLSPPLLSPSRGVYVIGLTGGIGCGKSTAAAALRQSGVHTVDADAVAHALYTPGSGLASAIASAFGADLLRADGSVDRRRLGRVVFADRAQRRRLQDLVWPHLLRRLLRGETRAVPDVVAPNAHFGSHAPRLVVIEAAVLLEAGWDACVDEVWVMVLSNSAQQRRLMARDGCDEAAAAARIAAQPHALQRVSRAHVLLSTEEHDGVPPLTTQLQRALAGAHRRSVRPRRDLARTICRATAWWRLSVVAHLVALAQMGALLQVESVRSSLLPTTKA